MSIDVKALAGGGAILASLPVGERVGIAFSGGLDTCCARRMDARAGRDPVRVHRRPRPVRRARRLRRSPTGRGCTARRRRCSSTAARRSRARASPRSSAARSTSRRPASATSTRRRSAARSPARCSCRRWRARRRHLGRRLDVQGQRHRALLPLRAARQREPAHLQAVARRRIRLGARRPQGDERVARRPRAPARELRGEGVLDRREPARLDARGEGSRAARHEHDDRRADHGRRALARARRDRAGAGDDRVRARHPGRDQRPRARRSRRDRPARERDRRPARARHVRPDREPDHRGEEPRHLRGARHGAPAHRVRAAADRDPQRGDARALRPKKGGGSAGCSTRAAGSTRRR